MKKLFTMFFFEFIISYHQFVYNIRKPLFFDRKKPRDELFELIGALNGKYRKTCVILEK